MQSLENRIPQNITNAESFIWVTVMMFKMISFEVI